jgi:hypothetical protein
MVQAGADLRLMAIRAKGKGGFCMAFVPARLDEEQIRATLAEVGIASEQALEIGGWRTTAQNVAVAVAPFPPPQVARP